MTVHLHPRGALRARIAGGGESHTDAIFRKLGVGARRCDLGDEGLYLAEEIVAADRWLGGSDPEALGILVLALLVAQRQGSSRLPLDAKGRLKSLVVEILRTAGLDSDASKIVKRITALTATPSFNSVIGRGDARLPLIVEDDCLYTERSRWLERRVAERLAARLTVPRALDAAVLADLRSRPGSRALSDEQMRAVELALSGMLTVVTGGPGTGKTLVAATIVRGFARLGIAPVKIALAAQTGKAATRMTDVIATQLRDVANPADADRALLVSPPTGQTLHRLLGYRGEGFAHHAQSPLPMGAVIIDEASMIDLELMNALLDAMPASVPLVLIGDAHQLPAIDAGQILADLADAETGARVGLLAHSFRMDASDPAGKSVYEAARAVHASEPQRLVEKGGLATLRTPGTLHWQGAEWVDAAAPAHGSPVESAHATASALWHHFDGPRAQDAANATVFRFVDGRVVADQAADLEQLWTQLTRARILTVTRSLPTGSRALNAYVHGLALARATVSAKTDFVPGEPVMVTANDYQRGLFNGDQGIVVRADEGGGSAHRYRAVFRIHGELVPFAIEALRDRLELAWALTVHKAQGSEMDAVAIVLPDENQPLLTRELLYTAITRARRSAVICGSKAAVVNGGKRVAQRHSGLATRLRAAR